MAFMAKIFFAFQTGTSIAKLYAVIQFSKQKSYFFLERKLVYQKKNGFVYGQAGLTI